MGKVASALDAKFVLGLGDNFYDKGINSQNQDRLESTFDNVFTDDSLQIEWWLIAGNHDHLGQISYEIGFSEKLARWKYPSAYYTFNKTLPSGKVAEFVMFDSVTIAGMSFRNETTGAFIRATGPQNKTEAEDQWTWLESQLAASKADYLFTIGHYPVWSACQHGPTTELVDRLRPLMRQYSVTAHLAGHDHCMQHIEEDKLVFVNSGAGSQDWYEKDHEDYLDDGAKLLWYMADDNAGDSQGGFASVTLTDDAATVKYYNGDGDLQYTAKPIAPRTTSAYAAVAV